MKGQEGPLTWYSWTMSNKVLKDQTSDQLDHVDAEHEQQVPVLDGRGGRVCDGSREGEFTPYQVQIALEMIFKLYFTNVYEYFYSS